MPDFQFVHEAIDHITKSYKVRKGSPLTDAHLVDYAQIAYFLSSAGNPFESALHKVSERLWDIYRDLGVTGGGGHRFTQALTTLAAIHGWQFDGHAMVVLMAGVEGEAYLNWVRAGTFFKDDMDAKHGEHSHTLQWLAIAEWRQHLQLSAGADFLYKHIYDAMPQKGTEHSLWSWLVDCFPTSMTGFSPASDSYRSPQYLMRYLFDAAPEDMFLKQYLLRRYGRRNWLVQGSGYANISGGATMKNHAVAKVVGEAPAWTTLEGTKQDPKAAVRVAPPPAPGPASSKQWKPEYVTCHGRSGQM